MARRLYSATEFGAKLATAAAKALKGVRVYQKYAGYLFRHPKQEVYSGEVAFCELDRIMVNSGVSCVVFQTDKWCMDRLRWLADADRDVLAGQVKAGVGYMFSRVVAEYQLRQAMQEEQDKNTKVAYQDLIKTVRLNISDHIDQHLPIVLKGMRNDALAATIGLVVSPDVVFAHEASKLVRDFVVGQGKRPSRKRA